MSDMGGEGTPFRAGDRILTADGEEMRVTAVPTPRLDQVTVARFTLDDFPLALQDAAVLVNPSERFALEDCLREIVDFEDAARRALELWRERRA